ATIIRPALAGDRILRLLHLLQAPFDLGGRETVPLLLGGTVRVGNIRPPAATLRIPGLPLRRRFRATGDIAPMLLGCGLLAGRLDRLRPERLVHLNRFIL